jgi:serine protease AprX
MNSANQHSHQHTVNRFAVVPTAVRFDAAAEFTGKGVTIAFLDSGFYPHPDIANRIASYHDVTTQF